MTGANRAAGLAHGLIVRASDDPEGREHDALGEGTAAVQVLKHAEEVVEVLLCEHREKMSHWGRLEIQAREVVRLRRYQFLQSDGAAHPRRANTLAHATPRASLHLAIWAHDST